VVAATSQPVDEASRVGEGFVPRSGIVVISIFLVAATALTLYSLLALWPTGLKVVPGTGETAAQTQPSTSVSKGQAETSTPERRKVNYFGASFELSTEVLFFLVVALSGAAGGGIHLLRSFSTYVGTRRLRWSWIPWNVLLPIVGALGGTVFYLVFRAGLFSPSSQVEQASPFGFAAIAALVGLFSEQSMEKLRQVAKELFAEAPRFDPDHYEPTDAQPQPGQPQPPPQQGGGG
jgi:hypothetical protein